MTMIACKSVLLGSAQTVEICGPSARRVGIIISRLIQENNEQQITASFNPAITLALSANSNIAGEFNFQTFINAVGTTLPGNHHIWYKDYGDVVQQPFYVATASGGNLLIAVAEVLLAPEQTLEDYLCYHR